MGAQFQCVFAHELRREIGIARFDRLDIVHMVDNRLGGAVAFTDRAGANGANMHENLIGHLEQLPRFAQLKDRLVEFDVQLRIFVEMGRQFILVDLADDFAQRADSSSLATSVTRRAAMLSSAAHARIMSRISSFDLRTR